MVWQRPDLRPPEVIRPVTFLRQFTKFAPGSVLVKFGDTQVLCTATVKEDVPRFLQDTEQGWLTAEYRLLPSSTLDRYSRELYRLSGRTAEIQRLLGRSLRAALDFDKLGPRTISIDADVLQADGSTRTAAITGSYVALYDACQWLLQQGLVATNPLVRQVAAVSVGIVEDTAIADLCYAEDVQASVDMNVVMTQTGEYVELQGTAEGPPFTSEQLDGMLAIARSAIQTLCQFQTEALQLPSSC
jgi:ribonuclease PH